MPDDNLDPGKVVNDPAFLQLPAQEQKKVLLKIDPQFKALPEDQQNLVIGRLHFPQPRAPQPERGEEVKGDPAGPAAKVAKGFGGRAVDTVKGLYHMVADPPTEKEKASHPPGSFEMQGRAALPLYRLKEGFVSGEKEAAAQTKQSAADTAALAKNKEYGAAAVQAAKTGVTGAAMLDPFATGSVTNINELQAQGKGYEAAGAGIFDALTLAIGSKWARGKLPSSATVGKLSSIAPKVVEIEGTKFIVPISEAEESAVASKGGLKQAQYKKAGIGAKEFDELNRYNQAAAREVIRRVAQKTSGMTGPMSESAGRAAGQAGDAVLNQARPMYRALDAALNSNPTLRVVTRNMSEIIQGAMRKAEKFGAPPMAKGMSAPGLRTPPLESYIQARSVLSDLAYKSKDAMVRRAMQSALDVMDADIEKAMKSSGIPDMHENFLQAQSLWAKGKAIQRVSEALDKATPGVPTELQAKGLSPRPPEIKPASLAQQLRKLDAKGDLTRGFGETQKKALYQVADILDRQTPVGLPAGQAKLWDAVKHAVAGKFQHAIAKAMVTPEGAVTINNLAEAGTPAKVAMYSAQLSRMVDNARAERWLPGQVQPPPGAQANAQ